MADVEQFMVVTGADESTAKEFLEGASGDVETAVNNFFVSSGAMEEEEVPELEAPAVLTSSFNAAGPSVPAGAPARPRPPPTGNVRGFADLNNDNSESDEEEQNEYYAGGEKSGQVVRAPKDKDAQKGTTVAGLFDRARAAGAVDGKDDDLQRAHNAGGGAGGIFGGSARRLDGSAPPDQQVPTDSAPGPPQTVVHTITFYRNNVFTVDDGEPRSLEDPANKAFLESVSRGECPVELEPPSRDTPVNVNLLRRDEEYVAPAKPRYVAFKGHGRTLAGTGAGDAAAAHASAPSSSAPEVPWEGVDEGKPTTSLQLRLSDGSRMVARFNLTHTVGDIRRFIRASRPDMPLRYDLVTTFPAKKLEDDSATIQAAELANAVVTQKG